jgi:uncharacterized membrane protein YkvA (DUF1232 family)
MGAASRLIGRLKEHVVSLKREVHALALALTHRGTPWYARLFAGLIVAYLLSPIDPIPDFLPLIGHLDELLLVPPLIALAIRMIPQKVMVECRSRAAEIEAERRLGRRGGRRSPRGLSP